MSEIRWLIDRDVRYIHTVMINSFGGSDGIRDEGLLASAIARPQNLAAYSEATLPALAASLAFGIARNHPFIDGNKRTAFVAAETFLELNGQELLAPEAEATVIFQELAAGKLTEAELAEWIASNLGPFQL